MNFSKAALLKDRGFGAIFRLDHRGCGCKFRKKRGFTRDAPVLIAGFATKKGSYRPPFISVFS